MLSVGSSDLDVVLVSDGLELSLVFGLSEVWQVDVDGSSQGSSEVSWARGDVAKMFVVREFGLLLNVSGSTRESLENGSDVSAWLHGDDSELIFFVDPDEESLGVIVENTSSIGPVSVQSTSFKISISLSIIFYIK